MKIGLLHESILPPKNYGGIERMVMTLALEYTRRGNTVVIFCRSGSQITDYESVELAPGDFTESVLAAKFSELGIDFLHSHQPLSFQPKIPFVVTIHGNGHPGEKYYANTNFLSESHARNHAGKYYIFNGVNPDHYPFTKVKQDYFVFLARTTWRVKNVKTAIAWANDLDVRLEIMGGSGVSRGKIRYHGLVDEKEKLELLANARALVYPTNWDEPCAAAPLEALACGTPVIASSNGCMPELIRPGTGVICDSYAALIAAPAKLAAIRAEDCRASVDNFFSLKRMAEDYLKLFDRIISMGRLDQSPHYNLHPEKQHWLFKPTLINRAQFALTGKI